MGGKAEDTIQSPKKGKGMGEGGTIQGKEGHHVGLPSETILRSEQQLRYHESKGEVHFHADADADADAKKLKCAVPVAEWFSALNKLKTWQMQAWQYLDRKRGTLLRITAGKNEEGQFDMICSLTLAVENIEPGPVLSALEKFTFAVKS